MARVDRDAGSARGDETHRGIRGGEAVEKRERERGGRKEEERNEARHISLACADSSSFVTVAAINNSAILSLRIIRVGLLRCRLRGRGGVFRSIQFGLRGRGRLDGLEEADAFSEGDATVVVALSRRGHVRGRSRSCPPPSCHETRFFFLLERNNLDRRENENENVLSKRVIR